jgi:hypothetical protein
VASLGRTEQHGAPGDLADLLQRTQALEVARG